ncbi:MAG TPA: CBS domain-containing protein [Xanthobacteraceae bacterium]|nr:CBS domain-containing protein [Xanthobacteraceae bacterium]
MTVKAILSRKGHSVVTIEPGATLADAARLLSEQRIGSVIVKAAGDRVGGLLSERDIVRTLAERGASALNLTVEQVMTRKVVTCTVAESVGDIMERMTTGKFRHLPVVEGERLIGIISIGDVVKHRLEEMEAESSAMREYIATA